MTKFFSLVILCCFFLSSAKGISDECCFPEGELFVSGDFLYWKAKQKGLDFTTHPLPLFTTTDFSEGALVAPSFDWNAGFRLAAVYAFTNTCWSAGLQYTQYNDSAHGTQLAGDAEGIFPTLSFSSETLPTDYVTSAYTHWKLNTYILDALGGYEWCINDCFSLVSTLAVRNVWITQNVHASYLGGTFSAGPDDVSLHSNFYGVGPRIGLKPIIDLGCGFKLYGEAAGSLLYGWFDTHQKETFLSEPRASFHRKPQGVRWNADLIAGLNWTYCTDSCSAIKEYSIDVGFDYLYFSKQYAFKHGSEFTLEGQKKYLALYGIHVSAGLLF